MLLTQTGSKQLGKIYFSDFFHPGLEALPYSRFPFQASAFCWAQSFDQYDFTRRMYDWMRPYEIMAFNVFDNVFVACEGLADLIHSALPPLEKMGKIKVVGLPFNSKMVSELQGPVRSDSYDVVYSSRFDKEKCPSVFLDVVTACPNLQFVICTGHDQLKGSDYASVDRAKALAARQRTNLTICAGLSKADYYAILAVSKVQFNGGLQDWVSFTLLEALTFGCLPLYPSHRSFPETLMYQEDFLYTPLSAPAACEKLARLLAIASSSSGKNIQRNLAAPILEYHDGTLERIADIIAKS